MLNFSQRERERVKGFISFFLFVIIFFTISTSVSATTLFQDTFTGVDGTRLNVHAPNVGTGWTEQAGTWTIESNKARADGTGGSYATVNATDADVVITSQVTMESSGAGQGFIARYTDTNNQFRIVWFGNSQIQIIKREAGVNTTLSSTPLVAVNGQTYAFALTLNGSSISLSIDGVEQISATSSFNQSATIHGIFAGASTGVRFDDFLIDKTSNNITLSTPSNYQIFQRNSSNRANIAITGTYTGTPTSIEASWNSGAYTTIVASPTGGTFSGTLSSQTVGQGTLTVRFTNDTSVTDSASYVGVGDVFLVAFAQSNAVGNLDNPKNYTHPTLKAGMFREDHLWAELADQTDSDRITDGSVWPLLATLIMADQNVPVAFITTAEGNTSIVNPGEWKQGGSAYTNAVSTYNASGVNGIAGILGWLGEADAMNGNSQADYQTQLPLALSAMQTDIGTSAPLILAMTGYISPSLGATESELNAIRLAQMYLWTNNANIHAGPVGHDIDLGGGDGVHYNSDADGQTMTNRWWRTIDATLYSGTESARGPQFSSATYVNNTITTIFTGGQGSLVNQTDKTGWSVTDGNGTRTVQSTTGTSNSVTLTVDQNLTGSVLISFGSGNNAAGATLRDSGTYPLPPEPFINNSVSLAVSPTPSPSPVSTSTSNSSSSSSPSQCTSSVPIGPSPYLYSASLNGGNSIILHFTNYQSPVDHFVIEYGTKPGEYKYSVDNISKNVNSYVIGKLSPNTTYYFRIRTGNGCAVGSWSNVLSTKTKGFISTNNLTIVNSNLEPSFAPTGASEGQASLGYILNVKVKDTKGNPVEGARITIHSKIQEATTDKDGIARFTNLESGDHTVLIAYKNFEGEQSLNLSGDVKEFNLNITVQEKKFSLSPLAWGIIGVLSLVIVLLIFIIIKNRRKKASN
ncbi:MAG TPA: sialate O-acetylesterase [Alphaproteobacteria bacterium]|jgi:hypothetical protein|nr:sialate O-acetylesterase [Alphaproteobacteria bacterium]